MTIQDNPNAVDTLVDIAMEAGDILRHAFKRSTDIQIKQDGSPITDADLASHAFITKKLQQEFPFIPIVSEENTESKNLSAIQSSNYFIVDPLDGTQSFIRQCNNFTVNIGYIEQYRPCFGVICHPMSHHVYFTDSLGISQKKTPSLTIPITTSDHTDSLRVIMTANNLEANKILTELSQQPIPIEWHRSISSSYKFCLLADGFANLYPRRCNLYSWDIAAGHAILNGASGHLLGCDGLDISYDSLNMPFFNAFGQNHLLAPTTL